MNVHFRQLIKGTGVMAVAGLLEKGVAFFLLPLYTRYLTPADYGAVELFVVTLAILDIVVQQGMVSAVFKRISYDKGEHEIESYRPIVGTALIFVLLSGLVVGLCMVAFAGTLAPVLFEQEGTAHLMAFGAITLIARILHRIMTVPLRSAQKYTLCAGISFLVFLAKLLGNLVFLLYLKAGFASLIYGQCAGACVGLVAAAVLSRGYVRWTFDRAELKVLTRFGRPLILSGVALLALNATDRFLLRLFGDNADVGLYSIAAKCGYAINAFLLGPFRATWPTVYYKIAREDGAKQVFGRFALRFFAFGLLAAVAAHWFAPYLLWILTTPAYYDAATIVGLMVGSVFLVALNDILKVGMNIKARTRLIPARVVLAGVVNLVLGIVLIPRMGIAGAALASVVSYVIMDAFTIWACRSFYRIEYDWSAAAKLTTLAGAFLAVQYLLPPLHIALDLALKFGLLTVLLFASLRILQLDLLSLVRRSLGARA